jgi:hypothetical protein
MKNPCKFTEIYSYTHDCILNLKCLLAEGWLAILSSMRCKWQAFFIVSASLH